MKKLLIIAALALFSIGARASRNESFVRIEAITPHASMISEATLGPLDISLYEDVMAHLNDYTEFLVSQGETISASKINQWIALNKKYFTNQHLMIISNALKTMDKENYNSLMFADYKKPGAAFALSFFLGPLGIDRFYIGDIGLGVGKLLTAGGLGLWAFIDLFCIIRATKKNNFEEISMFLTLI